MIQCTRYKSISGQVENARIFSTKKAEIIILVFRKKCQFLTALYTYMFKTFCIVILFLKLLVVQLVFDIYSARNK